MMIHSIFGSGYIGMNFHRSTGAVCILNSIPNNKSRSSCLNIDFGTRQRECQNFGNSNRNYTSSDEKPARAHTGLHNRYPSIFGSIYKGKLLGSNTRRLYKECSHSFASKYIPDCSDQHKLKTNPPTLDEADCKSHNCCL